MVLSVAPGLAWAQEMPAPRAAASEAAVIAAPEQAKEQQRQEQPVLPAPPTQRLPPVANAAGPTPMAPRAAGPGPAPSRWLPWTLFGVGAAATGTAIVAFTQRERHATEWNSAACVQSGERRRSVCGDELNAIHDWDRVMLVSGVAAGAFLVGAVIARSLEPSASSVDTASAGCDFGWRQVLCRGRF